MTCNTQHNMPMSIQQNARQSAYPVKESIRDLARLNQIYSLSDEQLWVFFNARVLLDQPVTVADFVPQNWLVDEPYGQIPMPAVG